MFYFLITLLFQNCVSVTEIPNQIFYVGPDRKLPPGLVYGTFPSHLIAEDIAMFPEAQIPEEAILAFEKWMIEQGRRPPGWKYDKYEEYYKVYKDMPMLPTVAKPEDYRFFVTVYGGKIVCGGAVIGTSWVLTAAHCIHSEVLDKSGQVKVRSGFTSPKERIQEKSSAKLIIHKKYDANDLHSGYDIGLIQVSSPFKITKNLGIIPIAGPGLAKKCQFGSVCGIGHDGQLTRNGASMPYQTAIKRPLRCAYMQFDNSTKCEKSSKAPASVKSNLLFTKAWVKTCQADSGGPLICQNVVVGVIAKEGPCGGLSIPCQAYIKVESFFDFLEENIDGFLVPKGEGTVNKNQTKKAEKKSQAERVIHASFWQLCSVPLFIVFFLN